MSNRYKILTSDLQLQKELEVAEHRCKSRKFLDVASLKMQLQAALCSLNPLVPREEELATVSINCYSGLGARGYRGFQKNENVTVARFVFKKGWRLEKMERVATPTCPYPNDTLIVVGSAVTQADVLQGLLIRAGIFIHYKREVLRATPLDTVLHARLDKMPEMILSRSPVITAIASVRLHEGWETTDNIKEAQDEGVQPLVHPSL